MDTNPVASRSEPHLVRKITHFLFGSWAAWIYLAVVAASIAFAVISLATDDGESGANFAGVWPFFATMPWSLVFIGVIAETVAGNPDAGWASAALIGVVAVSALANLATIGGLMHVIRRPPASGRQPGPQPGPQSTAFPRG
jgi:hypothetical protein